MSNDVVGMASVLNDAGYEAEIFATHNLVPNTKICSVDALGGFLSGRDDIFLYHFSIGWDRGLHFLRSLKCRKVIKYHNVTPPQFFEGVNEDYANVCREGRAMLSDIGAIPADLFLSDSAYNMRELISAGASGARSFVVPPFHQVDRLLKGEAAFETLDELRDGFTNILMVGRLAPNKGHVMLVRAFAAYHSQYNPLSRLLIVGKHDPRLSGYLDAVRAEIREAGLERSVRFTQEVSEAELRAYFMAAHVFAITSEHEGFCVPMVEAMAYHVPVVACASSAITETLGFAGILWPERDPQLLAGSIDALVTNPDLAEGVGHLGSERYRMHFDNSLIADAFLNAMTPVLRKGPAR